MHPMLGFYGNSLRQVCEKFKSLQVVTGLLVAEVNVNTKCELGSGGVSFVSSISI